jgi:hypothetical protein
MPDEETKDREEFVSRLLFEGQVVSKGRHPPDSE